MHRTTDIITVLILMATVTLADPLGGVKVEREASTTESSPGGPSMAVWSVKGGITVRRGDDLHLICTVTGLTTLDVIRVYHRTDGHARTIADNGDIKRPFMELDRYRIQYKYDNGIAATHIGYRGIEGRDAGTLGCYRLGAKEGDIASVTVTVIVPVTEMYLASIGTDGALTRLPPTEATAPPPVVSLRQRRFTGVACVSVYDDVCAAASLPHLIQVDVGSDDVTFKFSMTTDSVRSIRHVRPSAEREGTSSLSTHYEPSTIGGIKRASGESGGKVENTTKSVSWDVGGTGVMDLDACQSTVTLRYFTDEPEPMFNRKLLVCRANVNRTFSSEKSAQLNVEYAPLIACELRSLKAGYGQTVTFICNVVSNPTAQVTLRRTVGAAISVSYRHLGNSTASTAAAWSRHADDSNYVVKEQAIGIDHVKAYISIFVDGPTVFGRYTITASNTVDATSTNLEIVEDRTLTTVVVPTTVTSPRDEEIILDPVWSQPDVVESSNIIANLHRASMENGAASIRTLTSVMTYPAITSALITSQLFTCRLRNLL